MDLLPKSITNGDYIPFNTKDIFCLLIPLMIEQLLTSLMGVADTLMVSKVSEAAISGVSCIDSINLLIIFIFEAFGVGGNIIAAQANGRKDYRAVRNIVTQLMVFQLVISLLLAAVFYYFAADIINILYAGISSDVFDSALIYMIITALSFPFLGLYTASASLYRSIGNTKLPVTVITTGNLLNIVGNAVLIFVFNMGAKGAAIATLISRIFSCVVLLSLQARSGQLISLDALLEEQFSIREIFRMLKVSIPTAMENGMFQFGKVVLQVIIVTLGTSAIAAQAIVAQLDTLASRPALAVGIGMITVCGQCIGAGRPDVARRYANWFIMLGHVLVAITGLLLIPITPLVCSLTSLSRDTSALVFKLTMYICACKLIIWPEAFLIINTLKAAGDVNYPMWVSMLSMWIFRVGGAFFLCNYFDAGLWGVWIAWTVDWFIRSSFYIPRFSGHKWENIKI